MNSIVDIGPQPNLEVRELVVVNPPSPFHFAVFLDDQSLYWLQWDWQGGGCGSYSLFKVPEFGQSACIAGPF
jgi:hypothetical protein